MPAALDSFYSQKYPAEWNVQLVIDVHATKSLIMGFGLLSESRELILHPLVNPLRQTDRIGNPAHDAENVVPFLLTGQPNGGNETRV